VALSDGDVGEGSDPRADARGMRAFELRHGLGHLLGGLETRRRITLERSGYQIGHGAWNAGARRRARGVQPCDGALLHPLPGRLGVIAREEPPVRERLPEGDADREHVRSRVGDPPGIDLLGSEVADTLRIAPPGLPRRSGGAGADVEKVHLPIEPDEDAVRVHPTETVRRLRSAGAVVEHGELPEQIPDDAHEDRRLRCCVLQGRRSKERAERLGIEERRDEIDAAPGFDDLAGARIPGGVAPAGPLEDRRPGARRDEGRHVADEHRARRGVARISGEP
jgi:hypothetical protein